MGFKTLDLRLKGSLLRDRNFYGILSRKGSLLRRPASWIHKSSVWFQGVWAKDAGFIGSGG